MNGNHQTRWRHTYVQWSLSVVMAVHATKLSDETFARWLALLRRNRFLRGWRLKTEWHEMATVLVEELRAINQYHEVVTQWDDLQPDPGSWVNRSYILDHYKYLQDKYEGDSQWI